MKRLIFIEDQQTYNPDSGFIAHIPFVKSKEVLLNMLFIKLMLPDYFGFNWDALSDCLRDFNWIKQKGIVLIHDELPKLDELTFQTYLQILIEAVNDWKIGEDHYLEIVFPKHDELLIERYLNSK